MDQEISVSVRAHVDLSLSSHAIRRNDLLQADTQNSELVLTYKKSDNTEGKLNISFAGWEEAFQGYLLVKNDERYGLAPKRVKEEPRNSRAFDVVHGGPQFFAK